MISASDLLLLLIVEEDLTEACWYVDGQINYLIDWTNEEKITYKIVSYFPMTTSVKAINAV